jgi:hypothetical protein
LVFRGTLLGTVIVTAKKDVVCFLLGCSPAFKLQTPRNNPKENIRYSKHGENLKSRAKNEV